MVAFLLLMALLRPELKKHLKLNYLYNLYHSKENNPKTEVSNLR